MGNALSKQPCPHPCSECDEGHHWLPDDEVNSPEHEAAIAGEAVWYSCKHCDAWIDCDEMDLLEDEPI
jgi:hypothetical protein